MTPHTPWLPSPTPITPISIVPCYIYIYIYIYIYAWCHCGQALDYDQRDRAIRRLILYSRSLAVSAGVVRIIIFYIIYRLKQNKIDITNFKNWNVKTKQTKNEIKTKQNKKQTKKLKFNSLSDKQKNKVTPGFLGCLILGQSLILTVILEAYFLRVGVKNATSKRILVENSSTL